MAHHGLGLWTVDNFLVGRSGEDRGPLAEDPTTLPSHLYAMLP